MAQGNKVCDRCGRSINGKGAMNAGDSDYRWMSLRTRTNIYLYDDGTEIINKTYDLCFPCRQEFYLFVGDDPMGMDEDDKKKFQAKIRRKIREER